MVDFLNLVFGNGEDTNIFWSSILRNQILLHFDHDCPQKDSIAPGLLLSAICFHCQLNLIYESNIDLFKSFSPFKTSNFLGFAQSAKTYKFKYLDINQMASNYLNETDLDTYEKILKIQESEEFALKTEDNYLLFNLKIKIIENSLKKSQRESALTEIEECLQIFHTLHPLQIKLYILLIKSSFLEERIDKAKSFLKKAETIINFTYQNYHPNFILFYDLFAEFYYEKNEFEKSSKYYQKSLNQSLKIFGINHMQTAESLLKVARLKVKFKEISNALEDFIKAFHIIEALKGLNSNVTSSAAYKIAHLLFKNGKSFIE